MKKQAQKRSIYFVTCAVVVLFLISTMQSASIQTMNPIKNGQPQNTSLSFDDNYYTWEDEFDNAQKIDESHSEHFLVKNGAVEMYGTYSQWTDAEWTRMKQITIESEVEMDEVVIKLIIDYDSDMKADYSDLRFKYNNDDYWLPYWIEEINPEPNNPYTIVWIRVASLIEGQSNVSMFYGNPTATDQSDYWSVFDENSWQKHYIHDHQVTYHSPSEGAWDPDVCWGDNSFFVTWEEGIPRYLPLGMIYRQQIRGCFYTEEGEPEGNRFDITEWDDNPTTSFRCENPSADYGKSGSQKIFFVAYEYYNTPTDLLSRDIKGAIVPTTTNNIDDVTRFNICMENGNQADPVVSFNDENDRFFVIWEDGRQGTNNYNIYGRFFSLNGNPVGPEKIISNRPNSQCEPWITFDDVNNHYMIVWEEGIDPEFGPFEIWGQLFTINGDPLGDAQRLSPQATTTTDYNFPCVDFCSLTERFLVTWQNDDISSDDWYGHIWGKIIDENGNTIIDTFKIANGEYERTNMVSHLSSSFFVVYDGGGDIWGKLVSSEGDVNPYVLQLSDSESDPADWANIASSGNHVFVSWEDTRINYADPYDNLNLPDIFANTWSFNTPSGSEVSYSISDEYSLILTSYITSEIINPVNLQSWHIFDAEKQGDITFDIVDAENPNNMIISDISSGTSIQSIQASSIRLKATFHRENPSSSPRLDKWSVSYIGEDNAPPKTTIEDIDGVQGLNDWYLSESVVVWLHAEDYPKDTGSGVNTIYYTLNSGSQQIYNEGSGLILTTSQSTNWMGEWIIVFWAVDNNGNIEDNDAAENTRTIKIDADRPYIEITSPAEEEQVEAPFVVKANPTDNVGIERVEFDIEPFGEREGLPYKDTEPPYEWTCDVDEIKSKTGSLIHSLGSNVMVRAQAFDESGQKWTDEVWVYISNWEGDSGQSFQNLFCLIYATGQGTVNTNGITIGGITLGVVNWDFSSDSICFSTGLGGTKSSSGPHHGNAILFLGIASSDLVVGVALSVSVTKS